MKKLSTLLLFSTFLVNSIFASAEFFMKINTNGNYTVSLANQTLSTSSNVFRFFDLSNGNYQLRVTENAYNGRVVYDKPIFISDENEWIPPLSKIVMPLKSNLSITSGYGSRIHPIFGMHKMISLPINFKAKELR